jgi:hypothetical protein
MYAQLGIEDDPDLARFTFSLGVMLSNLNRDAESEPLFARALAIYENLPATKDCYRARCMRAYATTLTKLNRQGEAETVLAQMRAITPPGLEKSAPRL